MTVQPAFFQRLDGILAALRSMKSTHLDRLAVEKLFGVPQRRAWQIMADLEGLCSRHAGSLFPETGNVDELIALILRGLFRLAGDIRR